MQNSFTWNYRASENHLLHVHCQWYSTVISQPLTRHCATQQMCVSRCLHCVGLSLIPMAIICLVCNSLLLFPNLKANFLLEGHVTAEATWGTGFWGSGFVVCLHVFVCWLQNNNSMTEVFFFFLITSLNIFFFSFYLKVLLSARTFVQSSQTQGCFAFRRKVS